MRALKIIVFILLLTLFFWLLFGCGVTKESDFTDQTTSTTETQKEMRTRAGDTVSTFNPVNVKYKDTTIYTYSYETKSVIRETYDEEGNQQIDCITDEMVELIETTKILVENDIELNKKLDAQFDPASLIWAIAGLGFVVLLIAIVGFFMIIQLKKALPDLVAKAVKEIV